MQLIDGNVISEQILAELKGELNGLTEPKPGVTFVRVGEDPASVFYVNKKARIADELGIKSNLLTFPETVTQYKLLSAIDQLNADDSVHGILVQAPLPSHIDENTIFNRVSPEKDVDGFNVINAGRLCQEDPGGFVPCTPGGIIELLSRSKVPTSGKRAVVVGRSLIVGKPVALLLMMKAQCGNATVTVCHSRTSDLGAELRRADIIIAAMGKPEIITADMVSAGATVIDVGINRVDDPTKKKGYRIAGDVDFKSVAPKCSYITPVPGGVGPMTVAMLMKNTVRAYRNQTGI